MVYELTQASDIVAEYSVPAFEITDISIDSSGSLWLANQAAGVVDETTLGEGSLDVVTEWAPALHERSDVPEVQNNPHTNAIAVDGDDVSVKDGNGIDIYRFVPQGALQSRLALDSSSPNLRSFEVPVG